MSGAPAPAPLPPGGGHRSPLQELLYNNSQAGSQLKPRRNASRWGSPPGGDASLLPGLEHDVPPPSAGGEDLDLLPLRSPTGWHQELGVAFCGSPFGQSGAIRCALGVPAPVDASTQCRRPRTHSSCPLPLHPCRITSISRTATARRRSTLRLVIQPNESDGARLASLTPGQRIAVRAHTAPLDGVGDGSSNAGPRGVRGGARGSSNNASGRRSTAGLVPAQPPSAAASTHVVQEGAGAPEETGAGAVAKAERAHDDGVDALPDDGVDALLQMLGAGVDGEGEGDGGDSAQPGKPTPSAVEEASVSTGAAAAGTTASGQRAIFRGVSAAEEAEALTAAAPLPAWLTLQGYTNRSVRRLEACCCIQLNSCTHNDEEPLLRFCLCGYWLRRACGCSPRWRYALTASRPPQPG